MPPYPRVNRRWLAAIASVALAAFAAKVVMALASYGATDILIWEADARKIQAEGAEALYRDGIILRHQGMPDLHMEFNHPPFMLRMLSFWSRLEAVSGLRLRFWLRLSSALADLGAVVLLGLLLLRSGPPYRPESLLMVAASPVTLMISGFHGNTDPVMIGFVLLGVYLFASRAPCWLAGAAIGMAMNFKILPVLLVPAIWFFIRSGRGRLQFAAGATAIFAAGSIPFIYQHPRLVWDHVFGYAPQSGAWGVSRLILAWIPQQNLPAYIGSFKFLALALIVVVSLWMNRGERRPRIELQISLLLFLLLSLTPGFGVQYLAWLAPWTALLTFRQALLFHLTGGIFLFAYYSRAAGSFPWYLADSVLHPVWHGSVVYLGLLCWMTVCYLAVVFFRSVNGPRANALSC